MEKGLTFTKQRAKHLTPLLNSYANIKEIGKKY
jgi:hypothetical protein